MAASPAERNRPTGGPFDEELIPHSAQRLGDVRDLSWLPPRMGQVFQTLLEARRYAADLQQDIWEFALDLPSLREMAITDTDLRWIVQAGFADFALEITLPHDTSRQFRRSSILTFTDSLCLVLTPVGVEAAESWRSANCTAARAASTSQSAPRTPIWNTAESHSLLRMMRPGQQVPQWDRERQELRVGGVLVKRFKAPAANQEAILAAFEEENWPHRIDDPLPPQPELEPKRRLHDTINSLNRKQKSQLIRFFGDGSGEGIRWKFVGPPDRD